MEGETIVDLTVPSSYFPVRQPQQLEMELLIGASLEQRRQSQMAAQVLGQQLASTQMATITENATLENLQKQTRRASLTMLNNINAAMMGAALPGTSTSDSLYP